MSENKIALVGFSINSELYPVWDGRIPLEKAPLSSIKARIGGTSANVATAIESLGGKSKLLALKGEGDDYETNTLDFVLRNCKIPYTNYPILTTSHFALLPDDGIQTKVLGLKGKIIQSKLPETLNQIEKELGQYRLATGVRVEEVALVNCLFNKHIGFRSLNPRIELIINKPVFYELLKSTDLLILNMAEYQACKVTSPSVLHTYGPSLVIVTDGENGGMFSHKATGSQQVFPACTDYIETNTKLFTTGCGDWFHGSFTKKCMEINKPFSGLSLKETLSFISFAARVAGKKITMEGASNGPTLADL